MEPITTDRCTKPILNKLFLPVFAYLPVFICLMFCISLSAEAEGKTSSCSARRPILHPLQDEVLSILYSHPAMKKIKTGIYIVSLTTGQVLADLCSDELFIPASNQKLFISAAALARLKPDYSFPTVIYARQMSPEGVVSGPLYIKGFGDPLLVTEELYELAREVKEAGVKKVTEGVIFDDSYFAPEENTENQRGGDPSLWYRAESGALSMNFNTITFVIRPASRVGQKPLVQWDPPSSDGAIQVINRATTTARSPRKALTIAHRFKDGINIFTVSGQISIRHAPMTVYRAIKAPSRYTAEVVKGLLRQKGIDISGQVRPGIVPENARVICQHQSKPLSDIVASLNKFSNNFIAQQLLKTLGAQSKGAPGNTEKGLAAIREFLEESGLGAENFLAADGCGLSRKNFTTPKKIVDLLTYMQQKFEYQPEYFSSLAIAGVDGTMRKRLKSPKVQGRVRVKTGLIDGVSCLSGYVYSYRNELIAFSIMMNQDKNQHHICKAIQDKIVEFLLDPK
ncbi:MAG: D-alanyl-D-alanine carboxypeptidase/D-alanyl-D-alanine-endopeptidase [bacterium]